MIELILALAVATSTGSSARAVDRALHACAGKHAACESKLDDCVTHTANLELARGDSGPSLVSIVLLTAGAAALVAAGIGIGYGLGLSERPPAPAALRTSVPFGRGR